MSQNYSWPTSSSVTITGTPNNAPIPSTSLLVAGENDSGNQTVLQLDSAGNLKVALAAEPLTPLLTSDAADGPASPGTSSTKSILIGVQFNTVLPVLSSGQQAAAQADSSGRLLIGSIASALPSGSNNLGSITNITGTVSLPTGASTAANQSTIITTLGSPFQAGGSIGNTVFGASQSGAWSVAVNNFPATQPVSGTVTAVQPTGSNLHVNVDNFPATQPVSGTVTANAGTGNFTVVQPTAANLNATVVGSVSAATPTALTITQAALSIGTSAVRLTVSGSAPSASRVALVATPDSTSTGKFYIGSSSVTSTGSTRGIQIVAGQVFIANNDAGDYYIISDTASQTVEVMEQA